ncbi:MAG: hypothetical protein R3D25_10480 [Geminicoccaceae bacterium]
MMALGLLLAACATTPRPGPPPPARVDSSLTPEAATAALTEALGRNGLNLDRAPGGLTATSADERFTLCDTLWVRERSANDSTTRGRFTSPDSTRVRADIRIEPGPRGSVVTWRTLASGSYLNRFDNIRFDARCATSGELEQLIEDAVRG